MIEALVDIKVSGAATLDLGVLGGFQRGEEARYEQSGLIATGSLKFDTTVNAVVEASQHVSGYRIADEPQTMVAQARLDGYTFSRVVPYKPWETWRDEARRLWEKYLKLVKPQKVTRIAVRYTNRIDIRPKTGDRLRDYLLVYPQIPTELGERSAGFLTRVELMQPDLEKGMLILSTGRTESLGTGLLSVLLDLDLYQMVDIPANSHKVWETVEKLHIRENTYFEACITDRARELFD